ncbi:ATP-binding protein [Desulfuromonas sp. KJ2020]|uniref:two-component system sensor histidine kinase NtrB n=1 Tax=Desulfuromonas sp. KJ2020 TaxID=2919173 RepID=UPI0020A785F9|nr:ATP-binding protein [Desulfuromonas sp. KJ2020]MCP3177741.1 ATP-binding protein [Desulfuromonas sp. KJ2020]
MTDGLGSLPREGRWRWAVVLGLVIAISLGHYLVDVDQHHYHDIFRRSYYLPIILAGLWFQLRGGLAVAILVSVVYAPHVVFQWGAHPEAQWEQYLEILLYHVIGGVTGLLSLKERSQRLKLEKTARRLNASYQTLKDQASQILTFEEHLVRASRSTALVELAAGLAHEIRNPLGSIRGTAEILKDETISSEQRSEFADILLREVDRMNHVVADFLQFARPVELGKKPCDLNALLWELVIFTTEECHRAKISVRFDPGDIPSVPVDSDQTRQVFLNLLLNAVQAMADGGALRIATHRLDDSLVVRFVDNGPGIAPEMLPKIFNPFFTTKQTGTGLGLAISQRIIQVHGGHISVQSRVGQGTTFEVQLPLGDEASSGSTTG